MNSAGAHHVRVVIRLLPVSRGVTEFGIPQTKDAKAAEIRASERIRNLELEINDTLLRRFGSLSKGSSQLTWTGLPAAAACGEHFEPAERAESVERSRTSSSGFARPSFKTWRHPSFRAYNPTRSGPRVDHTHEQTLHGDRAGPAFACVIPQGRSGLGVPLSTIPIGSDLAATAKQTRKERESYVTRNSCGSSCLNR